MRDLLSVIGGGAEEWFWRSLGPLDDWKLSCAELLLWRSAQAWSLLTFSHGPHLHHNASNDYMRSYMQYLDMTLRGA